jgi:hypothetical protein
LQLESHSSARHLDLQVLNGEEVVFSIRLLSGKGGPEETGVEPLRDPVMSRLASQLMLA